MNCFAIDTTKKSAKIATFFNDKYNTYFSPNDASHSESLLTTIAEKLEGNKITVNDLDIIGVVVGPGSFTGIRIGVSVVKAFMYNKKLKAVAVNSFDQLAYNINSSSFKSNYLICLNADNRGVYAAEYNYKTNSLVKLFIYDFEELKQFVKAKKINIYALEDERKIFEKNEVTVNFVKVKEDTLIKMIKEKADKKQFTGINELEPLYIKFSQAENQHRAKVKKNIIIEEATIEDVDNIHKIEIECFNDDISVSKDMIIDEFNNKDKFHYKATYNKEILGFTSVWKTDDAYNILNLAIKKDFRELGIASLLMEKLINFSKEQKDINKIFLEVNEKNTNAIKLYSKLGFKKEHIRKGYYPGGENAIIMFYHK